MRPTILLAVCLTFSSMAVAAGRFIPAGMPIACWMQEKNLSLKTAEPGDPVLCYLSPAMDFGRPLFPRGSYLTGRIEGGKAPGRLAGKGSLVLDFDRLVVSDSVRVPISVKVIAALKYKISPDGRIIGKVSPSGTTSLKRHGSGGTPRGYRMSTPAMPTPQNSSDREKPGSNT